MDIVSVNAGSQLINFASIVGQSPQSWRGWHCVQIMLNDLDENLQHECLFWARSLIVAYLQGAEGKVYFCEDSAIHILCKNVPLDIIEQTGQEICDLAYSESSVRITFNLYNLQKDGANYARTVLEQQGDIFSRVGNEHNMAKRYANMASHKEGTTPITHVQTIDSDSLKIMLIEDDPVTRWMVRNTLKNECDFVTAPTANKAFSLYTAYQPDLVFLDINLPDKNGYEVLDWIMRNDPGANVVMFSSNGHMDAIMSALEAGASGFITKPFVKKQLLNYVHNVH